MALLVSKKDMVALGGSIAPLWILYIWALLVSHASSTHFCNYVGGYSIRADNSVCPASVPVDCGTGTQPRCCQEGMTCRGDDPVYGNWCCQGDYDCSQIATEEPKCSDPDWTLYGKDNGLINSGAWCCLQGYKGFIQENGAVGCTPVSVTALSTGWSFASNVQTYSCETPTGSGSLVTATVSSSTVDPTIPTASSTSTASDQDNSQLPPGQIAGITIGAVAVLVLICLAVILRKRWAGKGSSLETANQPKEPAMNDMHSADIAPTTHTESAFLPFQELHNHPAPPRELENSERGRIPQELPQSYN